MNISEQTKIAIMAGILEKLPELIEIHEDYHKGSSFYNHSAEAGHIVLDVIDSVMVKHKDLEEVASED